MFLTILDPQWYEYRYIHHVLMEKFGHIIISLMSWPLFSLPHPIMPLLLSRLNKVKFFGVRFLFAPLLTSKIDYFPFFKLISPYLTTAEIISWGTQKLCDLDSVSLYHLWKILSKHTSEQNTPCELSKAQSHLPLIHNFRTNPVLNPYSWLMWSLKLSDQFWSMTLCLRDIWDYRSCHMCFLTTAAKCLIVLSSSETSLVTCDFWCEMGQAPWFLWIREASEGPPFSLTRLVTQTAAPLN